MHTVARMLNPLQAPLSIRGVFHQEYVNLHAQVAQLQGQGRVLVIRGDGGEAEVSADKRIPMVDIRAGVINETSSAAMEGITRPIAEDLSVDVVAQRLLALQAGQIEEKYGQATVQQTLMAFR
jgi:anthranilate phosphoribosyltransferase